jgi:hypothetical protein
MPTNHAAVRACACGHRAAIGEYCFDHAPIHALRLAVLQLSAMLSAKDDTIQRLRAAAPETE